MTRNYKFGYSAILTTFLVLLVVFSQNIDTRVAESLEAKTDVRHSEAAGIVFSLYRKTNGIGEVSRFENSKSQTSYIIFHFTIERNQEEKSTEDILMSGIQSYDQYSERIKKLNFGLKDDFSLNFRGNSYRPVLCVFENTYGLNPQKKVIVTFNDLPNLVNDSTHEFDVLYKDNLFLTGVHKFNFRP